MNAEKEKAAIKCLKSFQPRDINTGQNEYPKYRDNYLRAFRRMLDKRVADGLPPFVNAYYGEMTAEKVMIWWVGDDPRQLSLFGLPDYLKGAPII